ncbi:MAG: hypothetical protein ABSB73_11635 [Solirubrobacteraceae bacterium]|jgi:hypothetical protein
MRVVELDGGTVTLRERADVKVRQRQMLEAASVVAAPAIAKIPKKPGEPGEIDWERLDHAGLSYAEMQSLLALQNAAIVALVAAWTFPEPLPASLDDVLDMPAERYDQLAQAVRQIGAGIVTQETSFEPSDPRAPGFAQTPTPPSQGSNGHSRDTTRSVSTGAPSPSGESTATAPATA